MNSDEGQKLLHITSFASNAGGGVASVLWSLAHKQNNCEVIALEDETFPAGIHNVNGIKLITFKFIGSKRYGFSPDMLSYILKQNYDVIHVHGIWMFHCFAALAYKLKTKKKVFISPHGMLEPWILSRSKKLKWLVSNLYQKNLLRTASGLHALNQKEVLDIKKHIKTSTPIEIIPNYVDTPLSGYSNEDLIDIKYTNKKFVFLGRIHEKKGIIELIEAFIELNNKKLNFINNAQLDIYGWIDNMPTFENMISKVSTKYPNIKYHGPVFGKSKENALRDAYFFVLPSKSEGLPVAVLEAWAQRTPSIMTEECNLSEGFINNASLKVKTDKEEIIKTIKVADELSFENYKAMSDNSYRLVNTEFSSKSVIPKFDDFYKS